MTATLARLAAIKHAALRSRSRSATTRFASLLVGLLAPCVVSPQAAFSCRTEGTGEICFYPPAVQDPGGVLVKSIARVIEALNRVQQVTGVVQ